MLQCECQALPLGHTVLDYIFVKTGKTYVCYVVPVFL